MPALWPDREPAVAATLVALEADILLLQEVRPVLLETVRRALPHHALVVEDGLLGWTHEGTIAYDTRRWDKVEAGAEAVGMKEPHRRLFWARLALRPERAHEFPGVTTVLVATAHFSWQGQVEEHSSDVNLRKLSARATAAFLTKHARPAEPVIFGGDLNESYWPRHILWRHGLLDCFYQLHQPCRPTHPARPSGDLDEDYLADDALDWLHSNAAAPARHARVVTDLATHSNGLSPSDHRPVVAAFALLPPAVAAAAAAAQAQWVPDVVARLSKLQPSL